MQKRYARNSTNRLPPTSGMVLESCQSMKTNRLLILLISLVTFSYAHADTDVPYLVCDRAIIRQAIEVSKAKVKETKYLTQSRRQTSPDLHMGLAAVQLIENKVYGKRIFDLRHDVFPGASFSGMTISIYPDTLKLIQNRFKDPFQGNLFMVAHEIAHMIQNHWFLATGSPLTPHGLGIVSKNDDSFNVVHAETDCIGVELMRQAGYKNFSEIITTLELIHDDCLFAREKSFCDRAHGIRTKTVETFLNQKQLK